MFVHSEALDASTYETQQLCVGIEVRKSKYTFLEDRGAIRAQQDWNRLVGPCFEYRGTLGPEHSFISVTVPECLPERLEVISYANEFAFLHDDVTDSVSFGKGEVENNDMMNAFLEAAHDGGIDLAKQESSNMGKKKMQSQLFLEMMAIDPVCAKNTLKAWARFLEVGSSRRHNTRFCKMDDYIPYRIMDVGEMFWYGVVTFGLGLCIPESEMDLCRELMAPAWIAVGLQNDLWSWPKERDAAEKQGRGHVINALWVLMQEHKTDVDGAEQICRRLIKENVAKYLQVVRASKDNDSLSKDLRKYINAMQYSISGNVVWSLSCPRYNPDISFNKQQLEWMHHGVPASDDSRGPASSVGSPVSEQSAGSNQSRSTAGNLLLLSDPRTPETEYSRDHELQNPFCFEREVLEAPLKYIASLPSKGVREKLLDALQNWARRPMDLVADVKQVVNLLHNASLL
ncbi:hypothetical protein MCOR05_011786 [Pyricularia oryzae]|nr:hypothetical protein MCOR05_011786 [Pyricularia oryzae]